MVGKRQEKKRWQNRGGKGKKRNEKNRGGMEER